MGRGVSTNAIDRFDAAQSVADAVLYEGYVLYPYRASSRKNQARFQWGVLTPRAFSEAEGSERWSARSECLLRRREQCRADGPCPVSADTASSGRGGARYLRRR